MASPSCPQLPFLWLHGCKQWQAWAEVAPAWRWDWLVVLWTRGRGLGFGVLTIFRGLAALSSTNHLYHLPGVGAARLVCHPSPKIFLLTLVFPQISAQCSLEELQLGSWPEEPAQSGFSVPAFSSPCEVTPAMGLPQCQPSGCWYKRGIRLASDPPGNLRPDMVCSFKNSCCEDFKDVVTATLMGKWSSLSASAVKI